MTVTFDGYTEIHHLHRHWFAAVTMKCTLCGEEAKLVKAHIIPRCFYEIPKIQEKSSAIISTSETFSPRWRKIGIYDPKILCQDCEDKFKLCDDYACKLLLHGRDKSSKLYGSDGLEAAYVYSESNYDLLRQFFLGVLIRAELTADFFFQHVSLGPYRQQLIDYFHGRRPLGDKDFSVFIFYYADFNVGPLIVPPNRMQISDIKFYHFHLGRIGYCIKVDRRPCPKYLEPTLLRKGKPLVVIAKQFNGTQLHSVISDIVNNRRNNSYFAR